MDDLGGLVAALRRSLLPGLGFIDNDSNENSQMVPPLRCLDPLVLAEASEKDLARSRPVGTGVKADDEYDGDGNSGSAVEAIVELVI